MKEKTEEKLMGNHLEDLFRCCKLDPYRNLLFAEIEVKEEMGDDLNYRITHIALRQKIPLGKSISEKEFYSALNKFTVEQFKKSCILARVWTTGNKLFIWDLSNKCWAYIDPMPPVEIDPNRIWAR